MNLTACGQIEIWRRQFGPTQCHYQAQCKGHAQSINWSHTQAHCAPSSRTHTARTKVLYQSLLKITSGSLCLCIPLSYLSFLFTFHFSILISFQSPSNRTGWLVASNWTSSDEKFSSRPQILYVSVSTDGFVFDCSSAQPARFVRRVLAVGPTTAGDPGPFITSSGHSWEPEITFSIFVCFDFVVRLFSFAFPVSRGLVCALFVSFSLPAGFLMRSKQEKHNWKRVWDFSFDAEEMPAWSSLQIIILPFYNKGSKRVT